MLPTVSGSLNLEGVPLGYSDAIIERTTWCNDSSLLLCSCMPDVPDSRELVQMNE
jgi:hypothetical protein